MNVAKRIQFEIERSHITQRDLGVAIGVSEVMVSYWCNGKRVPTLAQAVTIAEYFGVSVDYLVGLSDNANRFPSLADELNLSDLAVANLRSIAASEERMRLLERLLSDQRLVSVLGNLVLAQKLRKETSGNIQTVNLPADIVSKVSKHGYVILSNRESADYVEDRSMEQIRQIMCGRYKGG